MQMPFFSQSLQMSQNSPFTYGMSGMSVACVAQMGPDKITDQSEECCICLENKKMIMLECNHKICNDWLWSCNRIWS
jgi:hypothetical protein